MFQQTLEGSTMLSRGGTGQAVHLGAAEDCGGLKNRFTPPLVLVSLTVQAERDVRLNVLL